MKLGIDLHNVRDGGGVNYITNILLAFDPKKHKFSRICLFGSQETLNRMPESIFIEKFPQPILSKGLLHRLFFMFFLLARELKKNKCDILYSPGGLYFGSFRPYITISRNMMPFEPQHWSMYKAWSFDRLRLFLLRIAHTITFRRADGMIFLTTIAENIIGKSIDYTRVPVAVIPHGVNQSLFKRQDDKSIDEYINDKGLIRLIYPSRLEPYKHQIEVIQAVIELRKEFPHIIIDLCGPANVKYKALLEQTLKVSDPDKKIVRYLGELSSIELPKLYQQCHLLIFASSCENLPNTLIEALSFGIPIVCSRAEPMPEVGKNACIYFNPTDSESIRQAIRDTICDWSAALSRIELGKELASRYSWETCADQTFSFLYKPLCS